jgi:hypothetical protein
MFDFMAERMRLRDKNRYKKNQSYTEGLKIRSYEGKVLGVAV